MQAFIPRKNYFRATADQMVDTVPLQGETTADVCVIGAGYTGLSASLELATAGFKVVVLEARTIGFGASGRNGGQICTGFASGQAPLEAQMSVTEARRCFDMAEEAKGLIKQWTTAHNIACDLTWGYLHCIPKARHFKALEKWAAQYDALGYGGNTLLTKAELEQKIATKAYHGALREAGAGHLHPVKYCLGLAAAAQKAGAIIHENAQVTHVNTGPSPSAVTAQGTVHAKFIIIAGNAYLGRLVPQLDLRIMPVGSYIIATEPLGEDTAKSLIRDNEAVANTNFIIDYFRRSPDHRLIFGGRASYSTREPGDLGAYVRPRMLAVYPQLTGVKIEYAWGGHIAITSNRLPDCGRLSPTVYYAHGYSGQGVALAGLFGKLMAEAIEGQASRFDLFAKIRHLPFPGRTLRTPMLVAAMIYFRLRDALA